MGCIVTVSPLFMQNNSDTRNAYWQACFCLGLSMALVGCYVALAKPLVSVFGVFALAWSV